MCMQNKPVTPKNNNDILEQAEINKTLKETFNTVDEVLYQDILTSITGE